MPEYEIMRWDSVITDNNTFPYPMVYIKPDKNFEEYIELTKNKNMFLNTITGTNSDYDDRPIIGMVFCSGYFPEFRPYFFNSTGYYAVVLFTNWNGYPPENGKVKIQGSYGPDNVGDAKPVEFTVPKPMFPEYYQAETNSSDDNKCAKLSTMQIGLIMICFLVIFAILLAISFRKKVL